MIVKQLDVKSAAGRKARGQEANGKGVEIL